MFLAEMDEQIKGLLNKYIIDSIYKRDSTKARNPYSAQNIDWPGETHNGRAF